MVQCLRGADVATAAQRKEKRHFQVADEDYISASPKDGKDEARNSLSGPWILTAVLMNFGSRGSREVI